MRSILYYFCFLLIVFPAFSDSYINLSESKARIYTAKIKREIDLYEIFLNNSLKCWVCRWRESGDKRKHVKQRKAFVSRLITLWADKGNDPSKKINLIFEAVEQAHTKVPFEKSGGKHFYKQLSSIKEEIKNVCGE